MKEFGLFCYGILLSLFKAFVVTKLWLWFVVPFFGLPVLPFVYALGLLILIQLVIPTKVKEDDNDVTFFIIVYHTLLPAIALLFGWILHLLS